MTGRGRRRRAAQAGAVAIGLVLLASGCFEAYDFTGDDRADPVVVDTGTGNWRNLDKPGDPPLFTLAQPYGFAAGDWDGDGTADAATITSTGDWVTQKAGTFSFPKPDQLPAYTSASYRYVMDAVPADYDGDHRTDAAWYRDTDGTWFIRGQEPVVFGHGPTSSCYSPFPPPTPGCGTHGNDVIDQDLAVPADYDGDGKADLATYNPRTFIWRVRSSRDGSISSVTMNPAADELVLPAPGDYDGVHHAQRALFGIAGWRIEGHATADPYGAYVPGSNLGFGSRYPAVADYDGDGRTDFSYVDEGGTWYLRSSADPLLLSKKFTLGTISSGPSTIPVAAGTANIENLARLTLLARNCSPGQSGYPKDC